MRERMSFVERRLMRKIAHQQPAPKSETWAVCFNGEPIYTFATFEEAVVRFNKVEHVAGSRTSIRRIA